MQKWRERCAAAQEMKRGFEAADMKRAASWATCAVGEWAEQLPDTVQHAYGRPLDTPLWMLGHDFTSAVLANRPILAMQLLDAIDDRVQALKRGEPVDTSAKTFTPRSLLDIEEPPGD